MKAMREEMDDKFKEQIIRQLYRANTSFVIMQGQNANDSSWYQLVLIMIPIV